MMENISEFPLLFVEDYDHVHHDILDNIADHETSLISRNDDNEDEDENNYPASRQDLQDHQDNQDHQDHQDAPPAKRRDRRPSDRTGIG